MTDPLPDLPGRLPEPPFRPTDGRYDAARAAAGRRRRRQVALSGGGATLAAVLLTGAALLGGPSGPQVLDDATPPGVVVTEQTAEPSTAPSPDSTPTAGPEAEPTAVPAESADPGTAPTDDASPEPGGVEDPGPTPSPDAPARPLVRGPEPTVTTYDSSRVCDGSGPTAPSGWCSYYDGDRSAPRGGTAELAAAVCRLPGQGTGTLRADDGEYALFYVGTELGARWNWRTGQRFAPEPRDFTVEPGTCLRLAVTWDLAGDDGRPLPPGDYDADARPALSPGNGASVNTQLVFTIT